jgi:hypothetical protein
MTATATRRKPAASYRIVQITQHWTIRAGAFYRDCVVELPDGSLRLYGIRDDELELAA